MLPNIFLCSYIKHKLEITNRFFLSHKGPVIKVGDGGGYKTGRRGGGVKLYPNGKGGRGEF